MAASVVRTTVDIPDAMYRRLRARAAGEGRSAKALILQGVEHVLKSAPGQLRTPRHTPDRRLQAAGHSPDRQCQDLRRHFFSLTSTSGSRSPTRATSP